MIDAQTVEEVDVVLAQRAQVQELLDWRRLERELCQACRSHRKCHSQLFGLPKCGFGFWREVGLDVNSSGPREWVLRLHRRGRGRKNQSHTN